MSKEWLYGRQPVREALRAARRHFFAMVVADGLHKTPETMESLVLAAKQGIPVRQAQRHEMDSIVGSSHHQGIALEASGYPYVYLEDLTERASPDGLFLALDHLQDPQNVGTLLRTAEAVGVTGVIIPSRRSAEITPAVVKASAGAVEYLRIARIANLARALNSLQDAGAWLVGLEKIPEAIRYDSRRWELPLAVIVGSEGKGISRLVREKCDWLTYIPMWGNVASLNVAISGSLFLYQVARDIRDSGGTGG